MSGRQQRRAFNLAVTWLFVAAGLRVTILAPEVCPPLTTAAALGSAAAAAGWIADNQGVDGRFLYELDRDTGSASDDYNLVRHAGTTMTLYQVIRYGGPGAGSERFPTAADRALDLMLSQVVTTGEDAAAWGEPGTDLKLGAAALLAVSLLERRAINGDTAHDELLVELGTFMAGQQQPDGSMLDLWDRATGAPNPAVRSRYATGEALWALALLHETFPGEGFDEVAWATLDYLATSRDEVEGLSPRPWPDQWAAYSLEAMGDWGLADHHLAYARELSGQFGVAIRWDSQRSGIGTVTHPPQPRGAGFGTVLEGSSMLQRLAAFEPRLADLAEPLADRVRCGAARLATAQTMTAGGPEAEAGAWFRDGVTRMDDQQHAASAMLWVAPLAGNDR
ncbi:MAG: hypothetical protein H0V96_00475 [Acidimicrobiia bacterium]|nr:hypothetical protein [Acidimicrobiia bacterium]